MTDATPPIDVVLPPPPAPYVPEVCTPPAPDVLCYFNNGLAFHYVPATYTAQAGEVLFPETPTSAQLAASFSGYTAAAATQLRAPFIATAQAALNTTDVSVVRILAAGIAVPADILTYRAALRAIVSGKDTTSTALPTAPTDYPANT